jgi:hypothetical protein
MQDVSAVAVRNEPARRSAAARALDRILPKSLDNRYRGNTAALWVFGLLVFMKGMIDLVSLLAPDGGAAADGIPLATYSPAGAQAVLGIGAFLSIEGLMLVLVFVLALVRYRAMVPLMYVLLVIEYLAHKGAGVLRPIARTAEHSGSWITLGLFALTLAGLALSVTGKGYSAEDRVGRPAE